MFWAALASLIMVLTGSGDDTATYRAYLDALEEAVEEEVHDPERRKRALASVDAARETFLAHRKGLDVTARCLDEADRRYEATEADYWACVEGQPARWEASVERLLNDRRELKSLLTDRELQALRERVAP